MRHKDDITIFKKIAFKKKLSSSILSTVNLEQPHKCIQSQLADS